METLQGQHQVTLAQKGYYVIFFFSRMRPHDGPTITSLLFF